MWTDAQKTVVEEIALAAMPLGSNAQLRRDVWATLEAATKCDDLSTTVRTVEDAVVTESFEMLADLYDECRAIHQQLYVRALQPDAGCLAVWEQTLVQKNTPNYWLFTKLVRELTVLRKENDPGLWTNVPHLLHLPRATYDHLKANGWAYPPVWYAGRLRPEDQDSGVLTTFLDLYQPRGRGALAAPENALQAARDVHR